MKYIKYCILILLIPIYSCEYLNDENDFENVYSCSMFTEIIDSKKGVNPCSYTIQYNNTNQFYRNGFFQITLKNSRSSYNLNSKIVTLDEGRNTITVTIDNCNFQDNIQKACFMTK